MVSVLQILEILVFMLLQHKQVFSQCTAQRWGYSQALDHLSPPSFPGAIPPLRYDSPLTPTWRGGVVTKMLLWPYSKTIKIKKGALSVF